MHSFGGHVLKTKVTDCFPTLNDFLAEFQSQLNDDVHSDIMHCLQYVKVTVRDYLPPNVENFQWLHNPFVFSLPEQQLMTTNRRH